MNLVTKIEGYRLVDTSSFDTALHHLKTVSEGIEPLRTALLRDLKALSTDKDSFAKSIRLLDKFHKQLESLININI